MYICTRTFITHLYLCGFNKSFGDFLFVKKRQNFETSKHALKKKKKIKIKIRGKDIWRRENTERMSVLLVSLLFGFVLLRAW